MGWAEEEKPTEGLRKRKPERQKENPEGYGDLEVVEAISKR